MGKTGSLGPWSSHSVLYNHEFSKFQTLRQLCIVQCTQFCQLIVYIFKVSWLFTFSMSADCLFLSFRLYGDDALDNALNSFVKLLLSIPQSDLLVSYYFKLKSANVWFSILWNLTKCELIHSFFQRGTLWKKVIMYTLDTSLKK